MAETTKGAVVGGVNPTTADTLGAFGVLVVFVISMIGNVCSALAVAVRLASFVFQLGPMCPPTLAYRLSPQVLSTAGEHKLVRFSNTDIANTHPVYGLPAGYAFAIWGVIYLLEVRRQPQPPAPQRARE